MNKLLIVFLIFCFTIPVSARDLKGTIEQNIGGGLKSPEFNEFAPVNYIDAKTNSETLTSMEEAFGKVFNATFIGMPLGMPMKYHAELRKTSNYWASRKQNFESSVKYCKALGIKSEIVDCYNQLRKTELLKNMHKDSDKTQVKFQSKF